MIKLQSNFPGKPSRPYRVKPDRVKKGRFPSAFLYMCAVIIGAVKFEMKQMRWAAKGYGVAIGAAGLYLIFCSGCAIFVANRLPAEEAEPELKWNIESYAEFVQQNMAAINSLYSRDYRPHEFIVDTDNGSTPIQNLIEPSRTVSLGMGLGLNGDDRRDRISRIHQYVVNEYKFVMQPREWTSVDETIETGRGDCKNLSLLALSILIADGHQAYAAISNGHMWVNVYYDGSWHVLEMDQDRERNKIYNLPGFYDYPLYRIYVDHSEKRKKLN